jgi:hypothetical protein
MTTKGTPNRRGFTVTIFVPHGDPEGLKIVEKSNWTGQGLVIPRAIFAESKERDELKRTGVYLLIGPGESSDFPIVYFGEGDPVKPRLEEHAKKKDFWTHAVIFTSKDNSLHKAHIQQLESRLVGLAHSAKRCRIDNGNYPQPPSLTEAIKADAEGFLDDLLLCLPILGYTMCEQVPVLQRTNQQSLVLPDPRQILHLQGKGINARGFAATAGFVVLTDSQAVGDDQLTKSLTPSILKLRQELIRQQILVPVQDGSWRFSKDHIFSASSTAADVILGRSSSGPKEWKTDAGRTLKEIQESAASG